MTPISTSALKPMVMGRMRNLPCRVPAALAVAGEGPGPPPRTTELNIWAGPTWGVAKLGARRPSNRRQHSPGSSPAPP